MREESKFNLPALGAVVVENGIEKSSCDNKSYMSLELDNGLKVLLVSDEKCEKAAAAMSVRVGHFSDPEEIPGLAHFCEHMLFLGTKKYPDENDYSVYLNKHAGSSNAFTAAEETVYYFDVAAPFLDGALDRFAQFFIAPLFTASATDRELQAVDSEHSKNLQQDHFRLYQLEKSTCVQSHPYSKFATGDSTTLRDIPKKKGIDVREALLKFHATFYSSDAMGLCVVGKQPLEELRKCVVEKFSGIKRLKPLERNCGYLNPFEGLGPRMFYVNSVKDLRSIELTWPMPPLNPKYLKAPTYYISNLIGHEGPGSILAVLKEKGWATALSAGANRHSNFSLFKVSISCTEVGVTEYADEVIGVVFKYIDLLNKEGAQAWIFDEIANQAACDFRFQSEVSPINLVSIQVRKLLDFPTKHWLTSLNIFREYDAELINECLSYLSREAVQVNIVHNSLETNAEERWYKTPYKESKIAAEDITRWSYADAKLNLPPPNEFIPTDFEIYKFEKCTAVADEMALMLSKDGCRMELHSILEPWKDGNDIWRPPVRLVQQPEMDIWFKQDTSFARPKVYFTVTFDAVNAYKTPFNSVMSKLYIMIVKDALNEFAYAAEIAGLHYSIDYAVRGFEITVGGFSHKAPVLLSKIVHKMFSLEREHVTADRFARCRESLLKKLENWKFEQPYNHAVYNTTHILNSPRWHKSEEIQCFPSVTIQTLLGVLPQLLALSHFSLLVVGNSKVDQAKALGARIGEMVQSYQSPVPMEQPRVIELEAKTQTYCIDAALNPDDDNHAAEMVLQINTRDVKTLACLEILAHIAYEPFFNNLRTEKQLGYIVFCGIRVDSGVHCMRFIVQSTAADPCTIGNHVEDFLVDLRKLISDLSEEEWQNNLTAVTSLLLETDKTLFKESRRWVKEIRNQTYDFCRGFNSAYHVINCTKARLLSFFDLYIKKDGVERRKLLSGVYNPRLFKYKRPTRVLNAQEDIARALQKGSTTVIKNPWEYKSSRPLYSGAPNMLEGL